MSAVDSTPSPPNALSSGDISADEIAAQLSRVTASRTFGNAPVLRLLLEHLVTCAVSGNTAQLKEYALGTDVLGRGASFDPRVDTIVRVQARRLRSKLAEYYGGEGRGDPVLIELPKGHYIPAFRPAGDAATVAANRPWLARLSPRGWVAVALLVLLSVGLVILARGGLERSASGKRSGGAGVLAPADEAAPAGSIGVVVAPFENLTGDPALDTIGHRVAEQVIAAIATLDGAAVAARPTMVPSAGEVAADIVVSGTYYTGGDTVEFQAGIADARTGRLLHGFTVAMTPGSDLAATLEALRQSIAGAVAVHQDEFFGGLDVVSHPPTLDAYREYRAGLELFQSDFMRTLSHLERSHALAPRFVLPLAVMAFAHGSLGEREKADDALAKMERIADRLTSAERLLLEFLQASRNGRREQARRVLEELERLAPTSLLVNFNLIQGYVFANRPRAAVLAYLRLPHVSRTLRHSVESYRRIRFLDALHMLGEYERELEESRRAQADAPGVLLYVQAEVRALVALGRRAELHEVIDRSQALPRTIGWSETAGQVMEQTAHELRAHRSPEESLAMAAKTVEWYRSRPAQSGAQPAYREGLGRALYLAEQWHEAAGLFERLARDHPSKVSYRVWLAQAVAHTPDVERARLLSADLERAARPEDRGWLTYARACIAAAQGDRERAFQLLQDAFTEGLPHGTHLHQNADLEILRDYEPYQRLLRPVG